MASRYAVRILNGELERLVVPIDERLDIGRSSDAHLQLLGRKVSRSHASITAAEGGHVLTDLLSTNGTFVGGERVSRRTLGLGDEIGIGEIKLVFERMSFGPEDRPDPVSGESCWEETLVGQEDPIELAARRDGGEADRLAQVVTDIVLFRNLNMTLARKAMLPPKLALRYEELSVYLRTSGGHIGARHPFRRFSCDSPAELAFERPDADPMPVTLVDIAVDGARVVAEDHDRDVRDLCWLSVPIAGPKGTRKMVFTARVGWASLDELGLNFSGAPLFVDR